MLTMTLFALQHFKHARLEAIETLRSEILTDEQRSWLGLGSPQDEGGLARRISTHQWRRWWRIVSTTLSSEDLFILTNTLLLDWVDDPPLGDSLLFDATAHESAARPLPVELQRKLAKEGSKDLLLKGERQKLSKKDQKKLRRARSQRAHEARHGHATPTNAQPRSNIGGFHSQPVVCACLCQDGPCAPTLIVATDLLPASGYAATAELLKLLDYLDAKFGTGFVLIADRAYSHRRQMWSELRRRGRKFAFDLRESQLGPRGEHGGALLYQGNALCPATPRDLRNPGKRPMTHKKGQPNAEYRTWVQTLRAQLAYRCHIRSNRDHGVNVSCPALGPSPRVDCVYRGKIDRRSKRPTVLDPPSPRPDICANKTVFIPDEVNDLRQTWPWGRQDWLRIHRNGRSYDEGVHGELKSPNGYGLGRHVTNSSKLTTVAIHVALVHALFNLDKLRAFIAANPDHPFSRRATTDPLLGPDHLACAWLNARLAAQGGGRS